MLYCLVLSAKIILLSNLTIFLQKNFQAVDFEDAADAGLAYLVRVEQLELLSALVEVIS